jgi:hypothetical protein
LDDFIFILLLVFELIPFGTFPRTELRTTSDDADACSSGTGDRFNDPKVFRVVVIRIVKLEKIMIVQQENQQSVVDMRVVNSDAFMSPSVKVDACLFDEVVEKVLLRV